MSGTLVWHLCLAPERDVACEVCRCSAPPIYYLEGQGDVVSSLISPMTHKVTLVILVVILLAKSP